MRDELKLCGLPAVRARFDRDAASIQRLYFDAATGRKLGALCKALAAARKVYRCVEPAELERVGGTIHHGGVVAVVPMPPLRAPTDAELRRWAHGGDGVLVLDRIGNAHNLGAIARTAAFLGVQHLVLPVDPAAAVPNEAAYRVAEGGLEYLQVWRVPQLAPWMARLKAAGYDVVGAATRGGVPTAAVKTPLALVLGNEESGMAPAVAAACSRLVTLRGTGRVESLNVSVAAGILLHALRPTGWAVNSGPSRPTGSKSG
jgi:RNA methyltransferase, TrmH family